jgi:hypothetical protein
MSAVLAGAAGLETLEYGPEGFTQGFAVVVESFEALDDGLEVF